jgi:hypothetical protein
MQLFQEPVSRVFNRKFIYVCGGDLVQSIFIAQHPPWGRHVKPILFKI